MAGTASVVVQTLTNYARGINQDMQSRLAEFIAPTVPVGAASGKFKQFSDKNAFQVIQTDRPMGGKAKRLEFLATDGNYNCAPQALEIPIDDFERLQMGTGDPLGLEQSKVATLVTSASLSHEDKVFTAIKNGITAVSSRGSWSDLATNDPIKELDEQIKAIANATGMMPNRIAMGLNAWYYLRNHAKTIARQPGSSNIGITVQQLQGMLMNPQIEIRIGVLVKDTIKMGGSRSAANVVGDEAFIFHGSSTPTLYDPSFAKTFVTQGGGVDAVRKYREDGARSDIYAVDWSEDIQVVSTLCASRLTIS
jgi:hypothetical protein